MGKSYDIIICGGGASGMLLTRELISRNLSHLSVLVIEKENKNSNDRTWCFWDKEDRYFDHLLSNTFTYFEFYSKKSSLQFDLSPYRYKMLRSGPFYQYIHQLIDGSPNISWISAEIHSIIEIADLVEVNTEKGQYYGRWVFKSFPGNNWRSEPQLQVAQHFKGWFIETLNPAFNATSAIFMDFRIPQCEEIRFFYVLPLSNHQALVEIAIFSGEPLKSEEYDPIIRDYITQYLQIDQYQIIEEEVGIIPMTTYPFWKHNSRRIIHIGTGGGAVKPSSGYAFKRMLTHASFIAESFESGSIKGQSDSFFLNKYYFYDRTLLDVFLKQGQSGENIFDILFSTNKIMNVLSFLDGTTTLGEEISIFSSLPLLPFTKGFSRQVWQYYRGY
ncbi:MAG TPA: lycopene cyclase family protein [Saprospiraceae bacterium]|nr:lycopene cyclase family protein [Saprospiraceae bacterium]